MIALLLAAVTVAVVALRIFGPTVVRAMSPSQQRALRLVALVVVALVAAGAWLWALLVVDHFRRPLIVIGVVGALGALLPPVVRRLPPVARAEVGRFGVLLGLLAPVAGWALAFWRRDELRPLLVFLAIIAGAAAAGLVIRRLVRGRNRTPQKLTFDHVSFMLVFLGLPVLIVLTVVVWPILQAAYYSLTDWTGFAADFNFIGFGNFRTLWNDGTFRQAVGNNLRMALVVPFVTIAIALTFATLITVGGSSRGNLQGIRGSTIYRVVSFFPYVVPAIVIGLIWLRVFDPGSGLLNGVLTGVGFERFENYAWLGERSTARWAVMFVIIWGFVGFYMVLFVAAIKGVPAELYEAARIDGAGRLRMSFSITIPLIRDAIQTAYVYIGIMALDGFVYVQALAFEGGPGNSTRTISQELLKTAFIDSRAGRASAMGVVLAIVTLTFATIVFTVNRLTGGKDRIQMA